jgi:hypothetical protein
LDEGRIAKGQQCDEDRHRKADAAEKTSANDMLPSHSAPRKAAIKCIFSDGIVASMRPYP